MAAWPGAGISARAGPVGRAQGGRGCGAPGHRRCHRERCVRREMALAYKSALSSRDGEKHPRHRVQRGLFWFRLRDGRSPFSGRSKWSAHVREPHTPVGVKVVSLMAHRGSYRERMSGRSAFSL